MQFFFFCKGGSGVLFGFGCFNAFVLSHLFRIECGLFALQVQLCNERLDAGLPAGEPNGSPRLSLAARAATLFWDYHVLVILGSRTIAALLKMELLLSYTGLNESDTLQDILCC